ncbi:hypothetical protein HPB50_017122 [Hyalomma asiaticum]|uniref:Uncharacterized protein n=1 Tax=Hyalomma asiaticum TaxID=266040 RepID=A0ACB7TAZ2_HYAAI|nr:hypothetical protein HPB50_017122 [Hyalomma asiaticum]
MVSTGTSTAVSSRKGLGAVSKKMHLRKQNTDSGEFNKNSGQAQCSPGFLDEREVLLGDTWCVTRYRGPQSRARYRVAEVPRSRCQCSGHLLDQGLPSGVEPYPTAFQARTWAAGS